MENDFDFKRVHCFFEQSGTFKNQFRKFGLQSFDYDISNDFHETDFVVDLFREIEKAASAGYDSIFDGIIPSEDIVFAFFPCIRFSIQSCMWVACHAQQDIKLCDSAKLIHTANRFEEVAKMYRLFCDFVRVCIDRGIRLIVENPYHESGVLSKYFPFRPSIIDYDRSKKGDMFKKPTQYFFFGFSPKVNLFTVNVLGERQTVEDTHGFDRSRISPDYAESFILAYLINSPEGFYVC